MAEKKSVPVAAIEAQADTAAGRKERAEAQASIAAEATPTREANAAVELQGTGVGKDGLMRCEPAALPKEVLLFLAQYNLVSFSHKFGT